MVLDQGLAAFIIANKPGLAAFIIANKVGLAAFITATNKNALWVKFYKYRTGTESVQSGKSLKLRKNTKCTTAQLKLTSGKTQNNGPAGKLSLMRRNSVFSRQMTHWSSGTTWNAAHCSVEYCHVESVSQNLYNSGKQMKTVINVFEITKPSWKKEKLRIFLVFTGRRSSARGRSVTEKLRVRSSKRGKDSHAKLFASPPLEVRSAKLSAPIKRTNWQARCRRSIAVSTLVSLSPPLTVKFNGNKISFVKRNKIINFRLKYESKEIDDFHTNILCDVLQEKHLNEMISCTTKTRTNRLCEIGRLKVSNDISEKFGKSKKSDDKDRSSKGSYRVAITNLFIFLLITLGYCGRPNRKWNSVSTCLNTEKELTNQNDLNEEKEFSTAEFKSKIDRIVKTMVKIMMHFDREMPLRSMNTNLRKDESIYLNMGNIWSSLEESFGNLVPIQRRGLMGFSKPKIEGFAVPKTVNYQSLSLTGLKPGLAAFIIANKPGLAAFIIANRLALWVKFYNKHRKGSDSDHSGKIGEEILTRKYIQTDGNRAFNFKDHL